MKHNKLKNTGILFEILCKKIMHETLNPSMPQVAIQIVKKHFNVASNLLAELKLYQQLNQHDSKIDVDELMSLVLEGRRKINGRALNEEKYNLIKTIKKKYDINEFYRSRISSYKLLASIYNLFENEPTSNPSSYLKNKQFISESLKGQTINEINELETQILQQDPDIRKLSFKIIVEKFNSKYKNLSVRQQKLLSKYINEDSQTASFKDYILKECNYISKQLNIKVKAVEDPIQKIKVKEVIKLLEHIIISDKIKEDHLSSMLKYYELIEKL